MSKMKFSYKQAQSAAIVAIERLKKMNIPIFRPPDYYAEMAKSDQHMDKVWLMSNRFIGILGPPSPT